MLLRDLTTDELIAHLLSNQGIALSRDGHLDDALARYDRALELAPQLVVTWYNRGIDLTNVDGITLHPLEMRGVLRMRDDMIAASFGTAGWTPDVTLKTPCPREWTVRFAKSCSSTWRTHAGRSTGGGCTTTSSGRAARWGC